MAKDFLKSNPAKELEAQMNQDFNKLIRKIHKSLSTKKRSPVYTGFFASSWKAQTMGVKAKDKVEDFQPWASIKQAKKASWNKDIPSGGNKSYKIQPRFKVDKTFNFKKPVFIGNRAKYAAYALETGKVQFFVQGELGKLIQETMTSKGKIFVASRKTGGFGSFEGGVGYTEF